MKLSVIISVALALALSFFSIAQAETKKPGQNKIDVLIKNAQEALANDKYEKALEIIKQAESECKKQHIDRFDIVLVKRLAYSLGSNINLRDFVDLRRSGQENRASKKLQTAKNYSAKFKNYDHSMAEMLVPSEFLKLSVLVITLERAIAESVSDTVEQVNASRLGEAYQSASTAVDITKLAISLVTNWRELERELDGQDHKDTSPKPKNSGKSQQWSL